MGPTLGLNKALEALDEPVFAPCFARLYASPHSDSLTSHPSVFIISGCEVSRSSSFQVNDDIFDAL